MKKTNKLFAIMMAAVMAIPMVACESNVEPATPVATTAEVTEAPEPTEEVVEPEVTEAPEPTEEVVEPEPTEEPVSDNPNIIDGIDFSAWYDGEVETSFDIIDEQADYDSLRIFITAKGKAYAILADGESFTQEEEVGHYTLLIYAPKPVTKVEAIGEHYMIFGKKGIGAPDDSKIVDGGDIDPDFTATDYECGAKVTYEDGTEETIKVYITKEYTYEL